MAAPHQAGRLDFAGLVSRETAGHIKQGTGSGDHRVTRRNGNRPTPNGELGNVAIQDGYIPGQIAERRSNPASTAVGSSPPEIHQKIKSSHGGLPLQGRIGQLRTAHLHMEKILGLRNESISRTTHINQRTRIKINLAAGEQKLLAAVFKLLAEDRLPLNVGPAASPNGNASAWSVKHGTSIEVHSQALDVDLRALSQTAAGKSFPVSFQKNRGDTSRSKLDRTCLLREKRRLPRVGDPIEIGIPHRSVARAKIDPSVEIHRSGTLQHTALVDLSADQLNASSAGADVSAVGDLSVCL